MAANNHHEHDAPTEVQFFLLNEEGRRYFHTADEAISAYRPGDVLMCEILKNARAE